MRNAITAPSKPTANEGRVFPALLRGKSASAAATGLQPSPQGGNREPQLKKMQCTGWGHEHRSAPTHQELPQVHLKTSGDTSQCRPAVIFSLSGVIFGNVGTPEGKGDTDMATAEEATAKLWHHCSTKTRPGGDPWEHTDPVLISCSE